MTRHYAAALCPTMNGVARAHPSCAAPVPSATLVAMRCPRLALLFAPALAALLGASSAAAYCRTATCPNPDDLDKPLHGQICDPPTEDDCGVAYQWRQPCISFGVQKLASVQVSWDVADEIMRKAFAAWTDVDCGNGEHPSIQVQDFGPIACEKLEYNNANGAGNINVLVFRDKAWGHENDAEATGTETLALTTVTAAVKDDPEHGLRIGDILDADVEVNSAKFDGEVVNNFTTSDTDVDVDLLSVLTHEAGHFLGLAHSQDEDATMFRSYSNGSTELRELAPDDVNAICATYPPGRKATGVCDGLPRHGYASECATEQNIDRQKIGCSIAPFPAPFGAPVFSAAALLALAARRARRARPAR